MSSSQVPSFLQSLTLIAIGVVLAHIFPKAVSFLAPIIRKIFLDLRSYCVAGKRSIRKEWEEREGLLKWKSTKKIRGVWEWDRKASNQNVVDCGIPFSSLKTFEPMCEATTVSKTKKANGTTTVNIGHFELYGRIGEHICIVSGQETIDNPKSFDRKILITSIKKTTVREFHEHRKNVAKEPEMQWERLKKNLNDITNLRFDVPKMDIPFSPHMNL